MRINHVPGNDEANMSICEISKEFPRSFSFSRFARFFPWSGKNLEFHESRIRQEIKILSRLEIREIARTRAARTIERRGWKSGKTDRVSFVRVAPLRSGV